MKTRDLSQSEKLKILQGYGFDIKTGKGGKLSPSVKQKITKTFKRIQFYRFNEKQRFHFQIAEKTLPKKRRSKAQKEKDIKEILELFRKGLGSKVMTPRGFFIRVPKGTKRVPRYNVDKDGVVWYHAWSARGKRMVEEIHEISPEMLAEDPPKAIRRITGKAKKRGEQIVLTVNGFDSVTTSEYSIDALAYYTANMLLPKFLDPNVADKLDPSYNKLHNPKKKKRTLDDFSDTFHIKITKYEKPALKRKGKKANRR